MSFQTILGRISFILGFGKDWHYDAVVHFEASVGRNQKRRGGYDLSKRKPAPDHSAKTKYALDEGRMPPGSKARFYELAASTVARGSPRKRVCSTQTAGIHWQNLKMQSGL